MNILKSAPVPALCLFMVSCESAHGPDSVEQAMEANRARAADNSNSSDRQKAAAFLVEMADARMMDSLEGEIAATRGTYPDVRNYANKMVQEQAVLLSEIQALAAQKNITLPDRISNAKADALEDLRDETGDDVDEKFMSMIHIDHKRDVKEFRKATEFADPDVRAFAQRRLPMIEQHLREIEEIKDRH